MKKKKGHRFGRTLGKVVLWIVLGFVVLSFGKVLFYKYVPVWRTPFMVRREVEALKDGKTLQIRKEWVELEDMSAHMVRAVVASEDNLFLQHKGFSQQGIERALKEKQKKGAVRHGGSTITQQTAKNIFTFGTRTYTRKAFEAYFTVLIEWLWGKERIMEVYLNVIEMGNGIFGVEAASQAYFGCAASCMTMREAALLAASLPNPRKYSVAHPGPYMQRREGQIMDLMPKMGSLQPLLQPKKNTKKKS